MYAYTYVHKCTLIYTHTCIYTHIHTGVFLCSRQTVLTITGYCPEASWVYLHVLVWAGIDLIFFPIASMGLCFGFVLETVLITQGCFRYCWAVLTQSQGLFCFSPHPTSEEARGAQGVGTQLGQVTPTAQGISHTIRCHVQHVKLGE